MSNVNTEDKLGCLPSILHFLFPKSQSKSPAKRSIAEAYKKRPSVFSKNETAFYKALEEVVRGRYVIFPKVRLADIVTVNKASNSQWQSDFNRINSKHFDYLLCNPSSFEPQYAIELDDRSHSTKKQIKRDKFVNELCTQTGLNLIRIPAAMSYSAKKIRGQILTALGQQS